MTHSPPSIGSRRGFTLNELLAVVAIMSLVTSFSVGSISSLSAGRDLNHSVEVLTRSAMVARQTAMAGGHPVALVVSTAGERAAITWLEARTDSDGQREWSAAGRWEKLPKQIGLGVFPRGGSDSFYSVSESEAGGALEGELPVRLDGAAVTEYSYIVFRPDGSVDAPAQAPSLTLKHLSKANLKDAYIILVQENSGRCKVIEP
ncbi:MAG: prepilin-type N-terminal cleavage/methylation domain-containing protein [Chthoniobacterales bacterium]|nr:prepilin-type N-terminal cleavage/methylation domain-containing protein [Chthoniobacterales bacterium]